MREGGIARRERVGLLGGRERRMTAEEGDLLILVISYQGEHFIEKKHNVLDLESKECVFV